MHRLYTAANLPEAYLLRALLAHAGIEAFVFNEHAHGGLGEIPFMHACPELWLADEADIARATRVIRGYEAPPPASRMSRPCSACGEDNPGGFELCWRCGRPFAGEPADGR